MRRHHAETGITDEAAIEGHDLIHNAELEEERLEEERARTRSPSLCRPCTTHDSNVSHDSSHHADVLADKPAKKESTMDKVKEALHMKK
ncbi:hypothetical protein DCS_03268 [Drechmeria coniospora]|uniref:Uncharacterized protein n=1 Tax=Drechmeria coniospora TaxID=98403 RepID=A0A151GYF6_DRECN|nr:hypothetical protein DCS_03268 [Drechmeria coniospora]KYK62121.1 hypothetical protein DCS_03268 [Drechmeria coniospora]